MIEPRHSSKAQAIFYGPMISFLLAGVFGQMAERGLGHLWAIFIGLSMLATSVLFFYLISWSLSKHFASKKIPKMRQLYPEDRFIKGPN